MRAIRKLLVIKPAGTRVIAEALEKADDLVREAAEEKEEIVRPWLLLRRQPIH